MILTKQGGIIVKPISIVLGKLFDLIYIALDAVGFANIGIAIIIFTLIARLAILPLMIKQQKSSKIMSYIQPEIQKVTKKYKGKRDQESMMAQQRETKAIQDKYGASMTAGCLPMLIQLPIFLAVYRVISNIPAYVGKIYDLYNNIAVSILADDKAQTAFQTIRENGGAQLTAVKLDMANKNTVIDVLAKFGSDNWEALKTALGSGSAEVVNQINQNVPQINKIYDFFGINLTSIPHLAWTPAIIIPILSLVFQFLSMHVTPQQPTTDPSQEATMKTMKMMMNIMPIFSFIICLSVPAGVGLYWALGSLVSFLTTIFINAYFKKADMDKILEESKAKAEKKRAKHPNRKSFMEKMQEAAYANQGDSTESSHSGRTTIASQSLKSYTSNTMKKSADGVQYRKGSLAARANSMQNYKDK